MKDQNERTIEQEAARSKRRAQGLLCEQSRPSCCSKCGAPSRPPGGRVQMHGHGERARTQLGPEGVGQPPVERDVVVRRYRCTKCGATVTVAPREVVRRRLYGARAIALALALFGIELASPAAVREAIAPTASPRGLAEGARWSTLRRWSQEAKAGTLIAETEGRACPESFTLRQAAERVGTTLPALGPREADVLSRVWQGAPEARWRGAS